MAITPRNGDLTAGVAGSYSETIGASPDPFITGDVPALFSTDELVLEDEVLAARSVVGLDAAGKLVMAKTSATAVKPVGVLIYAVDATGEATNSRNLNTTDERALRRWEDLYACDDGSGSFTMAVEAYFENTSRLAAVWSISSGTGSHEMAAGGGGGVFASSDFISMNVGRMWLATEEN